MTSDDQRAGYEPDDAASGADWAPRRPEHSGTAASRTDRTPPEFGWAVPDASWDTPGDSWTTAYPEAAPSQGRGSDADFPGRWPAPQETEHRPFPPAAAPASGRADDPHRLPQRPPGRVDRPENEPGRTEARYEQTVRAPRAAVPAPPPPLPPQATRIPGASLAAEPPPHYPPPHQYERPLGRNPADSPYGHRPAAPYDFGSERQAEPAEPWADDDQLPPVQADEGAGFPASQARARVTPPEPTWEPPPQLPEPPGAWGQHGEPAASAYGPSTGQAAAARVPTQRSASAEAGGGAPGGAAVSASATVPAASRMAPPSDPGAMPMPAAQPRVYGRAVEAEDHYQREAGAGWPGAAAEPWSRDDRAEARGAPDPAAERHAAVPAPHLGDQQRGSGGRFVPPERPAPDAFGGPAAGTARPVGSAAGGAQPPHVDDRIPSDEGRNQPPRSPWDEQPPPGSPWDDQPPRQRWGGAAGNPDQTQIRPWDGPDTAGSPADAWRGARAEGPPAGQAHVAGTARVGSRDAGDGPPRQHSPAAAPPRADRDDHDQERFDSFQSAAQPPADPPPPPVRNGRVLAMVLAAAVLLLGVPLGTLWLLGRTGEPEFNPAVGSCVKQEGSGAAATGCGEAGAYTVVAKANDPGKCDPKQPHIVMQNVGGDNVLCLRPAAAAKK